MKKFLIFILVLLCFCINVSGCSHSDTLLTDDAFHFETDASYSLYTQGKARMFAESEDGYYFPLVMHGQHYMFFADKKTMQVLPLCNKPNCMHYEETDDQKKLLCNAIFNGIVYKTSIFYNNGTLYVPTRDANVTTIMSFSSDGSSRKKIFSVNEIPMENDILFHRGYCYMILSTYDENTKAHNRLEIKSTTSPNRILRPAKFIPSCSLTVVSMGEDGPAALTRLLKEILSTTQHNVWGKRGAEKRPDSPKSAAGPDMYPEIWTLEI